MNLQIISGLYIGQPAIGGNKTELKLKTNDGEFRISTPCALPSIRKGDMVSVILCGERLVTICDFSTGAQVRYPGYPFKSEAVTLGSFLGLAFAQFVLCFCAFVLGGQLAIRSPLSSIFLTVGIFWVLGVFLLTAFEWQRIHARNHNVALTDRIEKMLQRACLDPNTWPQSAESEWRDS